MIQKHVKVEAGARRVSRTTEPVMTRTYTLTPDQYIPHPASTKKSIVGPGSVAVTRWPDGGLDARIIEGCKVLSGTPRSAKNVLDV